MYIVATSKAEIKRKKVTFQGTLETRNQENGLKRPRITEYVIWRFHRLLKKKVERPPSSRSI